MPSGIKIKMFNNHGHTEPVECGPGHRLRQAQSDFQAVKKFNRTTSLNKFKRFVS